MAKLKVGYFADGPWSHEAFKLLARDSSIEIAFVCPRYDSTDIIPKDFSENNNIDYIKSENINSTVFIDSLRKYECDLFVSMSFNQVFKAEIINLPPLKSINCHAGKLPFYRGRNILNWVLINDEKEFGITVHYIDEGIDTGDILLQKTFEITDEDSYVTLLKKSYIGCADILYEAIKLIQNGNASRIKQESIHPVGMYCTQRKEGDEVIDWNQNSRVIFNFIRAISKPGPCARSYINNEELSINEAKLICDAPNYIGICGSVVGVEVDMFVVKTKDTFIQVTDYSCNKKVRVGDRLG